MRATTVMMTPRLLGLVSAFCLSLAGPDAGAQPSGPAAATFRVVRSVSGSRGVVEGARFVVTDPRTVFTVPGDGQIIVYFEWQGPPGKHRMEGVWRDPAGKAATITNFDYEARAPQFGAYWTLTLPERVEAGSWSLDAHIDGSAAGVHRFEIVVSSRAAPPAVTRAPTTPADAYDRMRAATVLVEKLDDRGEVRAVASGVIAQAGRVLTAFSALDGAVGVRITSSRGETTDVQEMLAFDRWGDWALLAVPPTLGRALEIEPTRTWKVGDHVYALSGASNGARTLIELNIAGIQEHASAGDRFTLSLPLTGDAIGGPVVNDYGAVIGFLTGQPMPGISTVEFRTVGFRSTIGAENSIGGVTLVRPWPQLPTGESAPTAFATLLGDGRFTPLLGPGRQEVLRGSFAQQVKKSAILFDPIGEKDVFSQRAGTFALMLNFDPKNKVRTDAVFRIYSLEGKLVGQSKPLKVRLDAGRASAVSWTLEASVMPPAVYRVDVVFGAEPVWRGYLKVTP
jgi:hypothetical protein